MKYTTTTTKTKEKIVLSNVFNVSIILGNEHKHTHTHQVTAAAVIVYADTWLQL